MKGCSRSAPAAAMRRRCSPRWPARSTPSSDTKSWPASAEARLAEEGYERVHVVCGDGTLGWPEEAPFDAIVVAAGGPSVPESLQRAARHRRAARDPGGRARGPAVAAAHHPAWPKDEYREEDLGGGALRAPDRRGGLGRGGVEPARGAPARPPGRSWASPNALRRNAEHFASVDDAALDGLLDRIGDARVVLLGEATHGTSEFYRMRDRITRR